MQDAAQVGQTALFGLALWIKCGLAGAGIGAAVAAAQIFSGRWHPAWAANLLYWFSCPFMAGLAGGVILALKSIPPLAEGRAFWLLLCLIIGGFTAVAASGALAYLSRNYGPGAAVKSKRVSRRSTGGRPSRTTEWENRLRSLFLPARAVESVQAATAPNATKTTPASIPGQKAKLPPPRFPENSLPAKAPHYAGNPRKVRLGQGKLEKPIK